MRPRRSSPSSLRRWISDVSWFVVGVGPVPRCARGCACGRVWEWDRDSIEEDDGRREDVGEGERR